MADLAKHFEESGYRKMEVFLDRNPTHRHKMQRLFKELMVERSIGLEVKFHLMAPYSPKLNLVEYAIHLIRQCLLHNADYRKDLEQFVTQVKELCGSGQLLSKEQVVNILEHIRQQVVDY